MKHLIAVAALGAAVGFCFLGFGPYLNVVVVTFTVALTVLMYVEDNRTAGERYETF